MTSAAAGAIGTLDVHAEIALRAVALEKAFGATRALRGCSLDLRAGEVHAVIGENGSGKSTLVKILAGVLRPDRGHLESGGLVVEGFGSPRRAIESGVVAVFQEVLVSGPRSVLDNVWMGTDRLIRAGVPETVRRTRAREVLGELLGVAPPLDAPVEALPLSTRQACTVARALVRDPRILILDEATSALDVATRARLFGILRRRSAAGTSVVFISHRMDEIEEIGDRVTVLRSGESVATLAREAVSPDELVRLMTGSDHLAAGAATERRRDHAQRPVVLRARDLRLRPGGGGIDFTLREGDLVGLAGLEGHGQDAFLRALWGDPEGRVVRERGSTSVALDSPGTAAAQGVAYVPRDRRGSLFASLSVRENFAAATIGRDTRLGYLRIRRSAERLGHWVRELAIKLAQADAPVTTLSGGNQQKVVMARWLATEPRILLLNDPTRGVDLAAKRDIYALLTRLASAGMAAVVLSTEVDEHVELMDRVLVFREGTVFAELHREQLTREALVSSFFGHKDGADG